MGRLALGRGEVIRRSSLPTVPKPESARVMPPEPDELWDAISLMIRNSDLTKSIEVADQVRAVGLLQELRRNQQSLGIILDRLELEENSVEERLLDTPAIVQAAKLAALHLNEKVDATSLSSTDDMVVSIQGRGFPFMAEFWVRGDYTNDAGALRSFPMQLTRQTSDLVSLEFSAGAPLSAFQAAVGSVVTLSIIVEMKSGRFITRAFERFTVG